MGIKTLTMEHLEAFIGKRYLAERAKAKRQARMKHYARKYGQFLDEAEVVVVCLAILGGILLFAKYFALLT